MAIIEIGLEVDDVENIAKLYDRIQLFRSPTQSGSPTPFTAITETDPSPAIVDGTVAGPWNLSGQVLSISLDSADPVDVTFLGANPFNLRSAIDQINAKFSFPIALEAGTDTNKVRLSSGSEGTQSSLLIAGPAASILGLSTSKITGKGANPLISPNTDKYTILDFNGLSSDWYKARYVNSETGAASDLSEAFPGGDGVGIPDSNLATGKIALSDITGKPIVGVRIIFVSTGSQLVSDGVGNNYGVLPTVNRIEIVTDFNGRASIELVKGQRMKVFIEGASFQREFVVPNTDFDILTVASVQPDPLSIVTTPPFPIRVS